MSQWAHDLPTGALKFEADAPGGDEITASSRRFQSMSGAIEAQIRELKTTDELRRELIANVSHDLRTPLASLRGYIETALVKAPAAYISIRGKWHYLYRAVDKQGKTVDFLLRPDRGIAAAQAFFRKALATSLPRWPRKVTLDGHTPSHRALWLLRRENPKWKYVRVDDRFQVISKCRDHDCRNRVGASNSQAAVLVWSRSPAPGVVIEATPGAGLSLGK